MNNHFKRYKELFLKYNQLENNIFKTKILVKNKNSDEKSLSTKKNDLFIGNVITETLTVK